MIGAGSWFLTDPFHRSLQIGSAASAFKLSLNETGGLVRLIDHPHSGYREGANNQ